MEDPSVANPRQEAQEWLQYAEMLLSLHDLSPQNEGSDLSRSHSYAMHAREADPTLPDVDEILAVLNTLLGGKRRIGNNQSDWYAVLGLPPQPGCDLQLLAQHYRKLMLILNPQRNRFPFAGKAFQLVIEAWGVLSNPVKRSLYDNELVFYLQPQQTYLNEDTNAHRSEQNLIFWEDGGSSTADSITHEGESSNNIVGNVLLAQQVPRSLDSFKETPNLTNCSFSDLDFIFKSNNESIDNQTLERVSSFLDVNSTFPSPVAGGQENSNNNCIELQKNYSSLDDKGGEDQNLEGEGEKVNTQGNNQKSFWTVCPYCYHTYEYPSLYIDCILQCRYCKKNSQAVAIQPPPSNFVGPDDCYFCWGIMPFGLSTESWEKDMRATAPWTPFLPMTNFSTPKVCADRNEASANISSSSKFGPLDDDLEVSRKKGNETDVIDKGKTVVQMSNRHMGRALINNGNNLNTQDIIVSPHGREMPYVTTSELSMMDLATNASEQPCSKVGGLDFNMGLATDAMVMHPAGPIEINFGEQELNMMLSTDDDQPTPNMNQGNEPGSMEEEEEDEISFFKGVEEYLSAFES